MEYFESMSLAYDVDYHRKLSASMLAAYRDNPLFNSEPRALIRQIPSNAVEINGKFYIQPGQLNNPVTYNDIDLRRINKGERSLREVKLKPARGRPRKTTPQTLASETQSDLEGAGLKKLARKGLTKTKKAATSKVGRKIIGTALDVALPAAGTALGTLGAQPVLGALAGKVGREGIRAATGFGAMHKAAVVKASLGRVGRNPKVKKVSKKVVGKALDIGLPILAETVAKSLDVEPEVGKKIGQYTRKGIKELTGLGAKGGKRGDSDFGAKMSRRRELVKKIMKDLKLSHKDASKHVKDKKMKY